jgi:hypothetical protein
MLFSRLILSLALFSFDNGFKLLLGSFNSKLVSESHKFLGVDAAEAVNGVLRQHVHFRYFLKFRFLFTEGQTFSWVPHPNVEGVV